MLPMGRGWLRSPNHPAPETNSAPARPTASGLHTRWAASSAGTSSDSALTANGRTRSPVALPAGPGELGRGLCPAAAAGGGGVGDGHQADGATVGRRRVRRRPASTGRRRGSARRSPSCSVEHALPVGGRIGRRRVCPPRRPPRRRARRGRPARRGRRSRWHATPRACERTGQRRRHLGPVGDDRARPDGGDRKARRRVARRTCDPKRALLPPPLTWFASAGARAMVVAASSRWASEGTSSLRTTSISRGSSITATSDPPAKSTRPWHDANVVARPGVRRAGRGPRVRASSPTTVRRSPSRLSAVRDPVRRPPCGWRRSARWR